MNHFLPFYYDFLFNSDDCMFHSAVPCGLELYKRDVILKTRLATNNAGFP